MKIPRERAIERLLKSRLRSTRASVYFEFAVFLPIVMAVVFFAVDFMRILYCEQQLEVGSRALCDIQAHIVAGDPVDNKIIPNTRAKLAVRQYLYDVLKNEGLGRTDGSSAYNAIYCKAEVVRIKTLVSGLLDPVIKFLKGDLAKDYTDNTFIKLLGKFFASIIHVVTFRTDKYLIDIMDRDLEVRASCSVVIKPFVPNGCWTFFGRKHSGGEGKTGSILITQFAPRQEGGVAGYDRKLLDDRRDRYYCVMPLMDTVPMSPATYVKMIKQKLKKFL